MCCALLCCLKPSSQVKVLFSQLSGVLLAISLSYQPLSEVGGRENSSDWVHDLAPIVAFFLGKQPAWLLLTVAGPQQTIAWGSSDTPSSIKPAKSVGVGGVWRQAPLNPTVFLPLPIPPPSFPRLLIPRVLISESSARWSSLFGREAKLWNPVINPAKGRLWSNFTKRLRTKLWCWKLREDWLGWDRALYWQVEIACVLMGYGRHGCVLMSKRTEVFSQNIGTSLLRVKLTTVFLKY